MEMLSLEIWVKVGRIMSAVAEYVTLTTKLADFMFPAASVAVHVTIVPPMRKNVPDCGLHDSVTTPTSSVAEGVANDTFFPVGSVV